MSRRLRNKKPKNTQGEISALRTNRDVTINNFSYTYTLNSSKVNYILARQIYQNTHDLYKLGAGFAKPIINSLAGFIGSPEFKSNIIQDDEELKKVEESIDNPEAENLDFNVDDTKQIFLDEQLNSRSDIFTKINRNVLRDGDIYIQVSKKLTDTMLYDPDEFYIDFKFIDPNNIYCRYDNLTGEIEEAVIKTKIQYYNYQNVLVSYIIIETWTIDLHTIKYEEIQNISNLTSISEKNPYGFIPLVKICNEADYSLNGYSEIEPVEPYLRAYNDVMLDYLKTNKLTAQPKLKIKTSNIEAFLSNNFTPAEISSKRLSLASKNVVFLGEEGDDAGYLEVSATNHFTLLEFLFMCIVDVSETPEFIFGTAIASSKASASEQMTPFLKKVERKRDALKNGYDLLCRMAIAINNMNITNYGKIGSYKCNIVWKEVDREDDQTRSNTIKTLIDGFINAVDSSLISSESAMNYLAGFIDTMDKADKEKIKIKLEQNNSDNNNNDDDIINNVVKLLDNKEGENLNNTGNNIGNTGNNNIGNTEVGV